MLVASIVLCVADSFPFWVLLAIAHNVCLSACSDCINSSGCLFLKQVHLLSLKGEISKATNP